MKIPIIGNVLDALHHTAAGVATATKGTAVTSPADSTRPEPLLDLSNKIGPVIGLATAALGVATNLGILNTKTSGFLNKGLSGAQVILGLVPAVIAGFAPMAAAHLVASQGRELVTPLSDPLMG